MNWDDLRYVLAIARERTLSRAGARLGATHTTVGRRLRAIEQALGVRLFDPTPDGFVVTAAGSEVVAAAERMESDLLQLEARVAGGDARLDGKLRVATMDLLFRRHRAAFASFAARHPRVELTVNASDVAVSLPHREADVALRLSNTPPESLVGRKVGRVDFAVFAARSLVERIGADRPLADYPWLHWDERMQMTWLDDWLAVHAAGARIAMRVDMGSLRDAVAAGIGVHFLATFEDSLDPGLVRIGPIEPAFGRDVWLLTQRELRSNIRVRAFMSHIEQALR